MNTLPSSVFRQAGGEGVAQLGLLLIPMSISLRLFSSTTSGGVLPQAREGEAAGVES